MAEELGKLKIKLDLDDEAMGKKIKDVKKELKLAQQEFKLSAAGIDKMNKSVEDLKEEESRLMKVLEKQNHVAEIYRKKMDELTKAGKENSDEYRKVRAQWVNAATAAKQTETQIFRTRGEMDKFKNTSKDVSKSAGTSLGGIGTVIAGITAAIGIAAVTLQGFGKLAEGIKNTLSEGITFNMDLEGYQNTLETVLKSKEKATETLDWAKNFAAQTPFELPQIIEATTKMEIYKLNAQKNLGIIGDMASVMGKDVIDAVEAIADAQTGELERLKEFGITKKHIENQIVKDGIKLNKVINKKGQITDLELFNKSLFHLMDERYKGGMERQSKTLRGMISNLKDTISQFKGKLSEDLFSVIEKKFPWVLDLLTKVTKKLLEIKNGIIAYFKGDMNTFYEAFDLNIGKVEPILANFKKMWENIQLAIKGAIAYFSGDEKGFVEIFGEKAPQVKESLDQLKDSFEKLKDSIFQLFFDLSGGEAGVSFDQFLDKWTQFNNNLATTLELIATIQKNLVPLLKALGKVQELSKWMNPMTQSFKVTSAIRDKVGTWDPKNSKYFGTGKYEGKGAVQTNNYTMNNTIVTNDPKQATAEQQRLMKQMQFQGR